MTQEQWQSIYDQAWHLYYTPQHIETLLRRAKANGIRTTRLAFTIFYFYASYAFEHVHPLQSGVWRRKHRRQRRSTYTAGEYREVLHAPVARFLQDLSTGVAFSCENRARKTKDRTGAGLALILGSRAWIDHQDRSILFRDEAIAQQSFSSFFALGPVSNLPRISELTGWLRPGGSFRHRWRDCRHRKCGMIGLRRDSHSGTLSQICRFAF